MMAETVRLEGFKELDRALGDLKRATAKAVLRRSLKSAAEPMARKMRSKAPKRDYDLVESIDVSTKLTKRQAAQHRKMFRDTRASVEVFVGPGPDPAAWNQEFGNIFSPPQPFVRPAFNSDWRNLIDRVRNDLAFEIANAAARAQRKAARA